jgi:hypothetical protein
MPEDEKPSSLPGNERYIVDFLYVQKGWFSCLGPIRKYRLLGDVLGFRKGQIVDDQELQHACVAALQARPRKAPGHSDSNDTDYELPTVTCPRCGAEVYRLIACHWCENSICTHCCYEDELYGKFCDESCYSGRWNSDNYD